MRHCDKCDVDVESNLRNCPLCGAYLQNDDGVKTQNKHAYKEVSERGRSRRIIFKLMLFASIIASVICLIVDVSVNDKIVWSHYLVTAVIGLWVVLLAPIFRRTPIRVQVPVDMVFAAALMFYAEYYAHTTNNWAFHIALPIVFMSTMGVMALLMIVSHKKWCMYAMTATPICILAIIPIFISLGVFHSIHPLWYVTCGIATVMLLSFFIFGKHGYLGELKKRLHF